MADQITVTPSFVNSPKPGKKYASIKVGDTYYSFEPEKIPLDSFRKGSPVTFEYVAKDYNGTTYYNITKLIAAAPAAPANGSGNYRQQMTPEESTRVTRLALAKSCIEANTSIAVAEEWLRWVNGEIKPKPEFPDDIPF